MLNIANFYQKKSDNSLKGFSKKKHLEVTYPFFTNKIIGKANKDNPTVHYPPANKE